MLEVQNYLMNHSLEELKETYGIDAKIYDDCILLNYSQIDSPKEEPIVKECRGLILSKDYKQILCKSFTRFFNYGECKNSQKGFSFDDAIVYEKIDGCLHEDTRILTTKGEVPIKELCHNPNDYKLITYNHNLNKYEEDTILGISIQDNNNNWYEISLSNGRTLIITGNHKVWCENLNQYKRVEDLDGSEILLEL